MAWPNKWSDWWRGFLGFSRDGRYKAIEILRQQYVEANQRASQLRRHAQNMLYPQFREKLLRIAADESRHGDQIAEKIKLLGAPLPAVPETQFAGGNSWQSLLADLEVQRGAEPSVMLAGLATDGVEENPRLAFPELAVPGKNLKTRKFGTEAFRPRLHPIHQTD